MKKAIILCTLDGYANSLKPNQLKAFLETRGFSVSLYSTENLARLGSSGIRRLLPYPSVLQIRLYFFEGIFFLAGRQKNAGIRKMIDNFILLKILALRGRILQKELYGQGIDLLLCENNFDEAVMFHRIAPTQIFDSPTPFAEELFYGGEISPDFYQVLKEFEKKVYAASDYLSFHWYTYGEFVKEDKYQGANIIDLGFGTTPKGRRARYSEKPKIVFLGFLGGYWANLPLLEKLSNLYAIDVYGGPRIPGLRLNYKGHLTDLDPLADYQFGLITITDDPLRRIGFSAKNIDYFMYGLPVLLPDWRHDPRLEGGLIHYNESNFLDVIKEYSDEKKWTQKSDAALAIANSLTIENAFAPLGAILKDSS